MGRRKWKRPGSGKEGHDTVPPNDNGDMANKLAPMPSSLPFTYQEAADGANVDMPNTGVLVF